MFRLRFNQVFVGLLALSAASAFVLPQHLTDPFRNVQKLFAPIAWPARKIAANVRERVAPARRDDDRKVEDVKVENDHLRTLVLSLQGQLEEMRRINEEREQLGDVRPMCTRFRVVGSDPAPGRDSLSIAAASTDNVEAKMAVLYANGVVGRIDRVSAGGAQVQLITDPRFQASARFYRYMPDGKLAELKTRQPLVRGAGDGRMIIVNVPLIETQGPAPEQSEVGVAVGDYVVLEDPDWPLQLKKQVLGRVEAVEAQRSARLYALIRVRPVLNLEALREVMVMNKTFIADGSASATP
jgi:cell shape-determining protein MreC